MSPAHASDHLDFLQLLWEERATAILRTDRDDAGAVMEAAVRGGFRIVELTLTIPGVFGWIAELAAREELTVGAGTVIDVASARRAVEAGARFLVSPVTDPEVISEAARLGVPMFPGAHTPTEMLAAHRAGATLVKIFPAMAGGPAAVRACLGPLPFLRLFPTHGVDGANAGAYLEAGAFGVGFVGSLFSPELLAAGDLEGIETRARALRRAVESVDRAPRFPG